MAFQQFARKHGLQFQLLTICDANRENKFKQTIKVLYQSQIY